MTPIAQRLSEIHQRIARAADRAARNHSEIGLIAVSKTHPVESVRELFDAGQSVFGENRVQELLAKAPLVPAGLHWHLIGHLQKNKIRKVLPVVELLHGVDSVDLAREIDRIAAELGLFPRVLLEVNVAGEESKFGFHPDPLSEVVSELLTLPRIQVEGLMTIAPYTDDPETVRPVFRGLRELRDALEQKTSTPLPVLSMGMSGDFEVAIEEGATLVRVGTALFGERPRPAKS